MVVVRFILLGEEQVERATLQEEMVLLHIALVVEAVAVQLLLSFREQPILHLVVVVHLHRLSGLQHLVQAEVMEGIMETP